MYVLSSFKKNSSGSKNKMLPMHLYIFNVVYLNFFDGALTHTVKKRLGFFPLKYVFLIENKVVFFGGEFFLMKNIIIFQL